jgi:hypothetical protein
MDVLLLLHVPPLVALPRLVVKPLHTCNVPVIAFGNGFTEIVFTTVQPAPRVYVITLFPAATPVTTPVVEPIVAIDALPLLHVPPVVVLVNEIVEAMHTDDGPPIAAGVVFTVTTTVAAHPVATV